MVVPPAIALRDPVIKLSPVGLLSVAKRLGDSTPTGYISPLASSMAIYKRFSTKPIRGMNPTYRGVWKPAPATRSETLRKIFVITRSFIDWILSFEAFGNTAFRFPIGDFHLE